MEIFISPRRTRAAPCFPCLLVRLKYGSCVLITLSSTRLMRWLLRYFEMSCLQLFCSALSNPCPVLDACPDLSTLRIRVGHPRTFQWPSQPRIWLLDAFFLTGTSACASSAASTQTPEASSVPIFTQQSVQKKHFNHLLSCKFFPLIIIKHDYEFSVLWTSLNE